MEQFSKKPNEIELPPPTKAEDLILESPKKPLEGKIIDSDKIFEGAKEINKSPEEILAAVDKQGEKIDAEVKEKPTWIREKIEKTADWYKKQALWKKVLFSAGCIGVASASAAVGGTAGAAIATAAFTGTMTQRMLGGLATFVTAEGFLKKAAEKGGRERTDAEAIRHTVEAAALGILIGSGSAAKAIKELSEITGTTDFIKESYNNWFPKTEINSAGVGGVKSAAEMHNDVAETIEQAEKNIAESKEILKLANEELSTIKKGEGIWHAVHRQLEEKIYNNPQAYNLKPEDLTDKAKIDVILNKETGKLLVEQGYIKPDGTETWISHEGTKVLLGADNKIIISGEGDNLTYEVSPVKESEMEMPKIKPSYMVNINEVDSQGHIIPKTAPSGISNEIVQPEIARTQPVGGAEKAVETMANLTSEKRTILDNIISQKSYTISGETHYPNMDERIEGFIRQIAGNKITPEEFVKYYEDKTGSFVSDESVAALKNNFRLISEGDAQQKAMARRAFEVIFKKINPDLAKGINN